MDRRTIGNALLKKGFSPADLGFVYLIDAIDLHDIKTPMMKIYREVAQKHGTTSSRVERCIRHSREKSNEWPNMDNRELIARMKWYLEGLEESRNEN